MSGARFALDGLAAGLLLLGLAYWWLGNAVHELAGTAMFLLLSLHIGCNRGWYGRLPKAMRQARGRIDIAATFLLLAAMSALLVTSLLISETLRTDAGDAARRIHALAAYWVLLLVGVHLGLRFPAIAGFARTRLGLARPSPVRRWALRAIGLAVAVHGAWSCLVLGLGARLSQRPSLDWWDFEASAAGFFRHCAAVVGLAMCLTLALVQAIGARGRRLQFRRAAREMEGRQSTRGT